MFMCECDESLTAQGYTKLYDDLNHVHVNEDESIEYCYVPIDAN